MSDTSVRVGPKGRVVIPATIRKQCHIEEGDELLVIAETNGIRLATRQQVIDELQGSLAGGPSLVDELIAERRAEAARDLVEFG